MYWGIALSVFSFAIAHFIFAFVNDENKMDFYYGLPGSKIKLYLSKMLAAILIQLPLIIIAFIISGFNNYIIYWVVCAWYSLTMTVFSLLLFRGKVLGIVSSFVITYGWWIIIASISYRAQVTSTLVNNYHIYTPSVFILMSLSILAAIGGALLMQRRAYITYKGKNMLIGISEIILLVAVMFISRNWGAHHIDAYEPQNISSISLNYNDKSYVFTNENVINYFIENFSEMKKCYENRNNVECGVIFSDNKCVEFKCTFSMDKKMAQLLIEDNGFCQAVFTLPKVLTSDDDERLLYDSLAQEVEELKPIEMVYNAFERYVGQRVSFALADGTTAFIPICDSTPKSYMLNCEQINSRYADSDLRESIIKDFGKMSMEEFLAKYLVNIYQGTTIVDAKDYIGNDFEVNQLKQILDAFCANKLVVNENGRVICLKISDYTSYVEYCVKK